LQATKNYNRFSLSQEAFEKEEFSGRPGNFSGTFFQKGKTGITTTEGRKLYY
jgi:hypothetical protein